MKTPPLTPVRDADAFRQAADKLDSINEAHDRAVMRLAEIETQMAEAPPPGDALSMAADILTGGDAVGRAEELAALSAEHVKLRGRVQILREAARLQRAQVDGVTRELSRQALPPILAAHRALAGRAAAALRHFDDLQREEVAMLAELTRLGYEVSFPEYVSWHAVGTLAALPEQSMLSMRVRDLERYAANSRASAG